MAQETIKKEEIKEAALEMRRPHPNEQQIRTTTTEVIKGFYKETKDKKSGRISNRILKELPNNI